jgi:hypothetical protein
MLEKDKMIFKVLLTAPLSAKVDISEVFRRVQNGQKIPILTTFRVFSWVPNGTSSLSLLAGSRRPEGNLAPLETKEN